MFYKLALNTTCVFVNFNGNKKDSTKLHLFTSIFNRLILFTIEIVIYGNISIVADNWQIIKCSKCFNAKINFDRSRGAFETLY